MELFYLTIIGTALAGIFASWQTISSLLWFVVCFIMSALYFIKVGSDFIGLILIIVYVGAVAMLFLYMIMLLGVKHQNENIHLRHLPIEVFGVFLILTCEKLFSQFDVWSINTGDWIQNYEISELGLVSQQIYGPYSWILVVTGTFLLFGMLIAVQIAKQKE